MANNKIAFGYAANEKLLKHYCKKMGAQHLPIYHEYQFIIEDDASINLLRKYNYERKMNHEKK